MIEMTISRFDLGRLRNKLNPAQHDAVIRRSLFKSANFISGWVKTKRLSGPRPNVLGVITGRLRSSITATPTTKSGNTYTAKIGTNVIYARRHEMGTYGMPARPFLKPALEDKRNRASVINDLRREIERVLAK